MADDLSSKPRRAALTADELRRYGRQVLMPEVGLAGQAKLKEANVLCVGAGGLGSPLLLYLAAAGVGRLGIVEFDVVDPTNLHRQILYGTSDQGTSKLVAARARLLDVNPDLDVVSHETRLDPENAEEIVSQYDVVADGTDNFAARYAVNEACVRLGKPNVHGAVFRFDGQVSVFDARRGPCYRCLFPEPPPAGVAPSCAEAGVLGVLPGIVGCLQAAETVKLILGLGEPLIGRLLVFDVLTMRHHELHVHKDPRCPTCGPIESRLPLELTESACSMPCLARSMEVSPVQLAHELRGPNPPRLLDVREAVERQISALPDQAHIPVEEVPERLRELDRDADWVVYCRAGTRSDGVVRFLAAHGFSRVRNLVTGINGWAREVDSTLSQY